MASKPSDGSGLQLQTINLWPFVLVITCRWALDVAGSMYYLGKGNNFITIYVHFMIFHIR